ncbi:conserved hypothetical protein [Burkholderiales bacterium 8X]|nr:conserved hypothetical protein [Burkholderiales bacterium 8X]
MRVADDLIDINRPMSRFRPRELEFDLAQDLPDEPEHEEELIEGLIGRQAMSVLYGDSNCGKTFLAIDLAAAVCRGGLWMGRNVDAGLVIYLASEAPRSVRERLKAYHRRHKCKVANLVIVKSPINLFESEADTTAVISFIRKMETIHGVKCELVIGDTLARLSAGANENSGEDMGVVVKHIDRIRQEAGVHFLLIHHSGKDAAKGMRGWSGLRAATDTEIEVTSDEATGARVAQITKQRDMGGKGDRIGFRLATVDMGVGRWGAARTSCVVVPMEAPVKRARGKRPSEIAGAIVEFLTARNSGCLKGAAVKHFEGRYSRQSVYREISKMIEGGLLIEVAGVITMPGTPGPNL